MEYYWQITLYDGTTLQVPPASVAAVKEKIAKGQPIVTAHMAFHPNQIRMFAMTDKRYMTSKMLTVGGEIGRVRIDEPMVGPNGGVVCEWVKKDIAQTRWNSWFSKSSSYRKLGESGGLVTMAYLIPSHQIDLNYVQPCTPAEIAVLDNGNRQ